MSGSMNIKEEPGNLFKQDIKVEVDIKPSISSEIILEENIASYCEQTLNYNDSFHIQVNEKLGLSPNKDIENDHLNIKNENVDKHGTDFIPVKSNKSSKRSSKLSGQVKSTFTYTGLLKQTLLDLYKKRKYPNKETFQNLYTDFQVPTNKLEAWFKRKRFREKPSKLGSYKHVSNMKDNFYGFKSKLGEFHCAECGKICNLLKNLRTHMQCHIEKPDKSHPCHVCKKTFSCKKDLNRHLLFHSGRKDYMCDICSKCFFLKCKLSEHMDASHRAKQYVCHICYKPFGTKTLLNRHISRHRSVRKFTCNECGKSFLDKSNLTAHLKIHMGIRKHICYICSMPFIRMSTLKNHMLTHSGIKNFHCNVCNKSFSQKWYLHQHSLTHSDIKNFTCCICFQSFIDKRSFNRHMTHHI